MLCACLVVVVALIPARARGADKVAIDRAVERGVAALRSMQKTDGRWDYPTPSATAGTTALAALTMLECGVEKDDPAIVKAANYVRSQLRGLHYTYSVAISILFFDRLGDPNDEQYIDALGARLVAGQCLNGAWTYDGPDPTQIDEAVIRRDVVEDQQRKAKGKADPSEDARRRRDFIQRVLLLKQQWLPSPPKTGDNSNTMFAVIALWVCRRHGLPVENCLKDAAVRLSMTQQPDGGWPYAEEQEPSTSVTMTCAGLLGLAIGYGIRMDNEKNSEKEKNLPGHDPSKDRSLAAGVQKVGATVGTPREKLPSFGAANGPGAGVLPSSTRAYYLLWGIERVAVALNLETFNGKDWYGWGSDILVAAQNPKNGAWEGAYSPGGVDTCFALLFLKKANFATDLSRITSRLQQNGRMVLSAKVGARADETAARVGIPTSTPPAPESPFEQKGPPSLGNSPSDKLAGALLALPRERQDAQIEWLRDQKGTDNTVALATAIPYLHPEPRKLARDALRKRVGRMKAATIGGYLQDDEPEIRRAAALAVADKDAKQFIPQLIALLTDPHHEVWRAAYAALKGMTGQDFGPDAGADEAGRKKAADEWRSWWDKQPH
jgi:hypothetical protein